MSEEQVKEEVIENTSLGQMFDGETETTETEIEQVDEVSDEPTGELAEDSKADTPEKDTDKAAPPAEDKPDYEKQLKAQYAKAKDEVKKRQKLQQQILDMQNKVEKPDAFAAPDDAIKFSQNEVVSYFDNKLYNMSEAHAKGNHKDYEEMADLFFDKLQHEKPSLAQDAKEAPDICEFIYQTAKEHTDMAELNDAGGVQALIDKKIEEAKIAWKAELADENNKAVEKKITESIPDSLSSKRAAGGNKAELNLSDTPLDNLFG